MGDPDEYDMRAGVSWGRGHLACGLRVQRGLACWQNRQRMVACFDFPLSVFPRRSLFSGSLLVLVCTSARCVRSAARAFCWTVRGSTKGAIADPPSLAFLFACFAFLLHCENGH